VDGLRRKAGCTRFIQYGIVDSMFTQLTIVF
jgi:hypothetical protein